MNMVNCTQFKDGMCLHQAAPRQMFGCAKCIEAYTPYKNVCDPRLPSPACVLKTSVNYNAPPTLGKS